MRIFFPLLSVVFFFGCKNQDHSDEVQQWTTHEIPFNSEKTYTNGYIDVEVWVQFRNDKGDSLVRPAFWDGDTVWKVRFAPPDFDNTWTWTSHASVEDMGLAGKTGTLRSVEYEGKNKLLRHGLLNMSPGKRNVVHADGKPFLVVGDTPWSIPFRSTPEQVHVYADDRSEKGFNTALLLTLQPDKFAKGPEARNTVLGFDRAFEDLPDGHVNKLKPDYFQTLDSLVQLLIDHGLTPV
ncbi:MAG: DUF5060 domain-containing protein [Cyclobacteriaceae bacterium]